MYWQTKEFLNERDKWYKILEEDGFEDIEIHKPGQAEGFPELRRPTHKLIAKLLQQVQTDQTSLFRKSHPENEYFTQACNFFHSNKFPSKLEKSIWEAHSEGCRITEIAAMIKRSRSSIHRSIQKLQKKMIAAMIKEHEDGEA